MNLATMAIVSSGQAGDHATLDVAAIAVEHYAILRDNLTVERLHHCFSELGLEQIRRFELPNVSTLHFVLYDAFAAPSHHWLLEEQGRLLASRVLELVL
jgi:hypothetical protein